METHLQLPHHEKNLVTRQEILEHALHLGWDDVGVTPARIPTEDIQAYHQWITNHYHGNLAYMENAIRCDPNELLPGAKTAILFVTYYKQPSIPLSKNKGVIASYARGRDYHHIHRKRLKQFIKWLEERVGHPGIARGFSDSAPIMEKALAVQAGLGWFGKNTLLIHRKFGTYTLLSGVLTTLEFSEATIELRLPRCGVCQRCLDACPTQALIAPYQIDATRCLSYHLIESKESIPKEIQEKNPGYLFGCDICQEACPHNWRKPNSLAEEFSPDKGIGNALSWQDLMHLQEQPEKLFGTPLQRRRIEGLLHTAETLNLSP